MKNSVAVTTMNSQSTAKDADGCDMEPIRTERRISPAFGTER